MKRLIFSIAFLILPIISFAQEEETIYTDTVDIVDFLEDVYLDGGKYKTATKWAPNDSFYLLENVVIISRHEIINELKHEKNKLNIVDNDPGGFFRYSEVAHECYQRLKKRVQNNADSFYFNYKIEINDCFFDNPAPFVDSEEDMWMSSGSIIFNKLRFKQLNMYGIKGLPALEFDSCHFESTGWRWSSQDINLRIVNSTFDSVFNISNLKPVRINSSTFLNGAVLYVQDNIEIEKSNFQNQVCDSLYHNFEDNRVHLSTGGYKPFNRFDSLERVYLEGINRVASRPLSIISHKENNEAVDKLKISNSSFSSSCETSWVEIKTHTKTLEFINNDISVNLNFTKTKVENSFNLSGNRNLKGLSIEKVLFSELKNYLDWNSISSFRILLRDENDGYDSDYFYSFYNALDSNIISNEAKFNKAIEMYKYLYDNYRSQGNTLSANGCYAEMKQVETQRWKYLYKNDKSFESFFRWQLNGFLSYFTDYGTNPAKAVIKSGWVILLFAVFYLFFPSDWDVSSRSELLTKIKELATKNREKSLGATLAFISFSVLIYVLNALTLSINAFTTLGFGDIPTTGAPRYVTIIEGFIGWFLLTIFSVSLISQVLG